MSTTVNDLERTVNSGLTTAVKKSQINFNQLFIYIDVEDVISTILFLKVGTINMCLAIGGKSSTGDTKHGSL